MLQLYMDYLDKVLNDSKKQNPTNYDYFKTKLSIYKILGGNIETIRKEMCEYNIMVLSILDYRETLPIKDLPY